MRSNGTSIVKNAAKLAVYDETMISVKNHQIDAIIRVPGALEHLQETNGFYHLLVTMK